MGPSLKPPCSDRERVRSRARRGRGSAPKVGRARLGVPLYYWLGKAHDASNGSWPGIPRRRCESELGKPSGALRSHLRRPAMLHSGPAPGQSTPSVPRAVSAPRLRFLLLRPAAAAAPAPARPPGPRAAPPPGLTGSNNLHRLGDRRKFPEIQLSSVVLQRRTVQMVRSLFGEWGFSENSPTLLTGAPRGAVRSPSSSSRSVGVWVGGGGWRVEGGGCWLKGPGRLQPTNVRTSRGVIPGTLSRGHPKSYDPVKGSPWDCLRARSFSVKDLVQDLKSRALVKL
eukprot:gene16983-biopygen8476